MNLITQMLSDPGFQCVCGLGAGMTILLAIGAIADYFKSKKP